MKLSLIFLTFIIAVIALGSPKKWGKKEYVLVLLLVVLAIIQGSIEVKDQQEKVIKEKNISRDVGSLTPRNNTPSNPGRFDVTLGDTAQKIIGEENVRETTVLSLKGGISHLKVKLNPEDKLIFNANLFFNKDGSCYITIIDNEYKNAGDCIFSAKQEDASTLRIKDREGREVFYAEFIDPSKLKIKGIFYIPGLANPIIIKDDKWTDPNNNTFSGGEIRNSMTAIEIN